MDNTHSKHFVSKRAISKHAGSKKGSAKKTTQSSAVRIKRLGTFGRVHEHQITKQNDLRISRRRAIVNLPQSSRMRELPRLHLNAPLTSHHAPQTPLASAETRQLDLSQSTRPSPEMTPKTESLKLEPLSEGQKTETRAQNKSEKQAEPAKLAGLAAKLSVSPLSKTFKSLRSRFLQRPIRLLLVSFAAVILLGASLLSLPISSSHQVYTPFLTSLFTATSATCVTGLVLVDTSTYWSSFGHGVILCLIQIGGLTLITILAAVRMLMHHSAGLKATRIVQSSAGSDRLGSTHHILGRIFAVTLASESIGAVLLTLAFWRYVPLTVALRKGIFHSVSSFCNAGFDLTGDLTEPFHSLIDFQNDAFMLLVHAALIIAGGLGFIVWDDLLMLVRKRHKRLRFHSKVVLISTLMLLVISTLFFVLEAWYNGSTAFEGQSGPVVWLNSFFQSVALRTAGYSSLDQAHLTDAAKWFSSLLMILGGGPGSTAGGIKVTTFFLLVVGTIHDLSSKGGDPILFHHRVPALLIRRSFSLLAVAFGITFGVSFLIYFATPITQTGHLHFSDIFFEASSAFGTVGVSALGTPNLPIFPRIVLLLTMFLGRVGPAAMVISFGTTHLRKATEVLPEAKVVVG